MPHSFIIQIVKILPGLIPVTPPNSAPDRGYYANIKADCACFLMFVLIIALLPLYLYDIFIKLSK